MTGMQAATAGQESGPIARRPIGRTGLSVTELGFGGASLGNLYRAMSDADAQATLQAALDAGIRHVDTAPHYGRGLSERRVGDALRQVDGVVLSTKVGRLLAPDDSVVDDRMRDGFRSAMPFAARYDYSHDGILRSHADSLQRLGLARVDLLYVHDIGGYAHGDASEAYWRQLTTGGGFRALERLRDEGAIAGFGVGVNEVAACLAAMRATQLDVILLAGRYTLLEQAPLDDLMPACAAAGTSIVIGGPYNSGILATGTRGGGPLHFDYGEAPRGVVHRVAAIEAVCARHGVPLAAAALAFVLAHPQVASVIPGIDGAARAAETLALYRHAIPPALWGDLREAGLIRDDAPVPETRS
ncbi:aldo/keto reductase [Sphingomonas sp.]|uniref:aldo/keto reductase n=1 Tax=Sphingomonas sp. TaxID=28214 RepID=UPI00258A2FBB|nr:aldo/keto reductase [Sphingomonas sp.]